MVQKSAEEEEIKYKGSKYRIYIPVYMELHIWEQMQYLLYLPLISSSFSLFCTLLALSEFAENQIFRAVAQYTVICLSLYWHMFIFALEPACNNKQPLHISLLKGSRHCKLQPSFSFISTLFFYHHPSPLRVALQRKLRKLPKRSCLKSTVMLPYKVLNLL